MAGSSEAQEAAMGNEKAETPRSPYFVPRRLGATAPHDCMLWTVDYRETGSASQEPPSGTAEGESLRTFEDADLPDRLGSIIDAGLTVPVS